ncbi:C13 family peptidase [Lichenihabitans psoromatis]|uniref:C13 family peptidase n=1 Tax=Lichenihabitans psoromatis TaxID=2528642 RepID=UPI001FE21704|nr:C13 family peptidase [Lichenihabitans psoromatis]
MLFWLFARVRKPVLGLLVALSIDPVSGALAAPSLKAGVVALALWSQQGVFLSEAKGAAHVLAARYGHGGPVEIRSNTRTGFAAGPVGMARAIRSAERGLDPARDVLFVVLTSHGSPQGIAEKGGDQEGILPPAALGRLLAASKIRRKVLIVSACFAGVYTSLADPDMVVITAADADHPSFGCQAGARWTYFGDAFFNQALRQSLAGREPLDRVFAHAAELVRAREVKDGFDPSNPQMAGGANVLSALAAP